MTELQKVSAETMCFMCGKYTLDEVPGKYYDIDCLKFRQGKRTIHIHEDHYDFQIIYGKAERGKFEARISEFPKAIQDLYHESRALPDGLWMLIRVDNLETLEAVKQNDTDKEKAQPQAISKRAGYLRRLRSPLRPLCSLHWRNNKQRVPQRIARAGKARIWFEA